MNTFSTHREIQIGALKMQFVCIVISAEYVQTFEFLISRGSVATCHKVRWVMSYGFCSKFYALSSSVKILTIGYDLTKLQRL